MLAYIAWHRAAERVEPAAYERALELFHRSLARVPPSGFRGSIAYRRAAMANKARALALGNIHVNTGAMDVVHENFSAIFLWPIIPLINQQARVGVWVAAAQGHRPPTLADLLADGMDREAAGLWRRCLGLGPAPEYCLLTPEVPAGVAAARLPRGWTSHAGERRAVWQAWARPSVG